jgi:DNA-directed RNA polymerase subunit RPC12/RpoP
MLRCEECGREIDPEDVLAHLDQSRWKAYLTDDDDVVIYCPDCAKREFDGKDLDEPRG